MCESCGSSNAKRYVCTLPAEWENSGEIRTWCKECADTDDYTLFKQ